MQNMADKAPKVLWKFSPAARYRHLSRRASLGRIKMKIIIAPSATQYRHEVITAEARLWRAIRGRRLNGFKFLRQVPRGPYICDFLCAKQLLAVEIGSEAEATGGTGGRDLEK